MARKSKGRQKIAMTKMTKESNLLVTFSKRRSGLFKKASELSTLCGVEIAIIVFSPGKKVFSFGHPSVQSIVDRYTSHHHQVDPSPNPNTALQLVEAHRNASVRQLNMQLTEMVSQLEAEKNRGEELAKMRKIGEERCWWERPVSTLGIDELEKLKLALDELKVNVVKQSEKVMMEDTCANTLSFFPAFSGSYGGLGHVGSSSGVKDTSGLGQSMVPYGYALGFGSSRGFF